MGRVGSGHGNVGCDGRMLVDAVHDRWARLPPDRRPELVLYGESLGSMAGQGAFAWLPDIAKMGFAAVLWVGPPHESSLWSGLVTRRDPGSREVEPRYDNGRTVRFSQAADSDDIARIAAGPWDGTRVLFLQHASDPIVWWSPELAVSRPEWLEKPTGPDVAGDVAWFPFVTFWQTAIDMAMSYGVEAPHGHRYGTNAVEAWAAIVPPEGWSHSDTLRLKAFSEAHESPY